MNIIPSLSLLNQINQFIQGGGFSLNYGLFLLSWKSGLRVSEAVSFDYQLKHPRHKDLYSVKGKGNKTRYVYISPSVVNELKTNNWQPNQTNRFAFNNFLKKIKEEMNISKNTELTPHTLRRCFTTHNAINGVPLPILQKLLGHASIKTTSGYWKGSVDIREFSEWLEPDSSPKEPDKVPKVKVIPKTLKIAEIPIQPEITSPTSPFLERDQAKPELLKTIAKLKRELAQKDLIIAKKDKQLQNKDSKISLLTDEKQQKDQQLAKYKEKARQLSIKNNSLIENYTRSKNTAENTSKNQVNNNQIQTKPPQEKNIKKILLNSEEILPNTLLKIKELKNNSLAVKEKPQTELLAQIQVWKPPN